MTSDTAARRKNQGMADTPTRKFRIEDDLWNLAIEVARENRESLSAVIRKAIVDYVRASGREVPKP